MNNLNVFVPITKVDMVKREVWGRAVAEVADRAREIFDYESSKPYFEKWSDSLHKASNGKSLGNVRAMHGAKAAGKLTNVHYNDAEKAIDVCAQIIDDNEWEKIQEGVYTGFSIGGKYIKKWKDNDLQRYTAEPTELSIVDVPCIPSASFVMVKSDGAEFTKSFKNTDENGLEQGQVTLDDALDDIENKEKTESVTKSTQSELEKTLPARLQEAAHTMGDILRDIETEVNKMADTNATKTAQAEDLAKADNSNDVLNKLNSMADLMQKVLSTNEDLKKSNDELKTDNESLKKRFDELAAQPAEARGALNTLSKAEDNGVKVNDEWKKTEDPIELMKGTLTHTGQPLELRKFFSAKEAH